MRVPTIDYTPLMRANQARTQSKRSQFIAPGIDYERESLKLRKEGILVRGRKFLLKQGVFLSLKRESN